VPTWSMSTWTTGSVAVLGGEGAALCCFMWRVMLARPTVLRTSQPIPWRARAGSVSSEMDLF
jgi:hypothetical protein